MKANDVAFLLSKRYEMNDIGVSVPVDVKKKVRCTIQSVSASEWMDAGRIGLKPEIRLTMFAGDYAGELEVEHEGTRYRVYRTYQARREIELYLERKAGVNNE